MTATTTPTRWIPTQKYDYNDDDDDEIITRMDSIPSDDNNGHENQDVNNDVANNVAMENAVDGNDQAGVLDEDEIEINEAEHSENDDQADKNDSRDTGNQSDADIEDNEGSEEECDELDEFSNKRNNPRELPKVNDRISYWDPDMALIISGTVTPMTRELQRRYPGWRNLVKDGENEESSVNLDMVGNNCVAWKYCDEAAVNDEQHAALVQQIDGGIITPESLSPSIEVDQTQSNDASLDWDNYASDPTFVSTQSRSPNRHNHSSTRDDFLDTLSISSNTTECEVFPPQLPPRARSSASVIQCNNKTCKPAYLRPPQ